MNPLIEHLKEIGLVESSSSLEEFEGIIKEGSFLSKSWDLIAKTVPHIAGAGLAHLAVGKLQQNAYKKMREEDYAKIQAAKNKLFHDDPSLAKVRGKAEKRLQEIAHFSPTVASMPEIAAPLIKRTLDSGLSELDVKNLVQIEVGKHQADQIRAPKAGFWEKEIPVLMKDMTGVVQKNLENPPLSLLSGPLGSKGIIRMYELLDSRGHLPDKWKGLNLRTQKGVDQLESLITTDPGFLESRIKEHGLQQEIMDFVKHSEAQNFDFSDLSDEAKMRILADQYTMDKMASRTAGMSLGGAALGLGLAALFGGASSAVEQGVNLRRTREMNSRIVDSWGSTRNKIKKLSDEGSAATAGVDFSDRENLRKAEEAFRTLADVAPSIAINPNLATSFVVRTVQNEGMIDQDVVKSLSEIQKNLNTTKQYRSPFADSPGIQGFSTGFAGAGGQEMLKNVGKALAEG